MRFPIAIVVGLALLGCAERAPAQVQAAAAADTLVVSSDPELRALASSLLPDLAVRSGLELRGPVRLERRSRAELETFLVEKLAEEVPVERADRLAEAYALLGLVPEGFDLRATLLAVYTEQVAGFYDPVTTTLYVLDDQPQSALEALLVHELVHAIQDQWVDLDSITAFELGNDRRSAAQAAIEGHATLVMLEHTMNQMGSTEIDVVEMPMFAGQLRPALEGVRDQYPALGSAPRIIQESLLLPYVAGAAFVQAAWAARGSRVPLAEIMPASTEQVSLPTRFTSNPPDAPTEVRLTLSGSGAGSAEVLMEDVLGFAETRVLLEELGASASGADGWDGDRWALVEQTGTGSGTGTGVASGMSTRGVVWVTVFDSEAGRDRFVEMLRPRLSDLPARATLAAMAVDGRPVAMLRVGVQPEVEVALEGGRENGSAGRREGGEG